MAKEDVGWGDLEPGRVALLGFARSALLWRVGCSWGRGSEPSPEAEWSQYGAVRGHTLQA